MSQPGAQCDAEVMVTGNAVSTQLMPLEWIKAKVKGRGGYFCFASHYPMTQTRDSGSNMFLGASIDGIQKTTEVDGKVCHVESYSKAVLVNENVFGCPFEYCHPSVPCRSCPPSVSTLCCLKIGLNTHFQTVLSPEQRHHLVTSRKSLRKVGVKIKLEAALSSCNGKMWEE